MYVDQCTSDFEEKAISPKRFQVSEGTSTGTYTAIYTHTMYLRTVCTLYVYSEQ